MQQNSIFHLDTLQSLSMDNYCVISKSLHTLGFACLSKSCILVDGISSLHMIRHQQQSSLLVTICHVCCKQMISLKTKQKTVNYFINLLQTTHHHYDNTAASPQASSTQIFWLPVVPCVSCCYLGITIWIYVCQGTFSSVIVT